MKKLKALFLFVLILAAMSSCGGRHICEAYGGQADYSKYQANHSSKLQFVEDLTQAQQ